MTEPMERRAIVSGIGQSAVGRRLGRSGLSLTAEACLAAIEDAGLTRADIDGLATYPGDFDGQVPDLGPGIRDVQDALRLRPNWHVAVSEGAGQTSALIDACMAVACGLARHVLVYRTVIMYGGRLPLLTPLAEIDGPMQYQVPFGVLGAPQLLAPMARRHMHEFGTTREQLGAIAVNARRNAALNPHAIYRDSLTIEDYLAAPMVSDPFGLLDCDAPCDGSTAFIVSYRDFAPDCRNTAVHFDSMGMASHHRPLFDQWEDLASLASRDAARQMWSRTSLRAEDVDLAELYDGFTFLALNWIEDLGFCEKGDAGAFVENGKRIALEGELPMNTDGGQLSGGRLHGFGLLHEACVQLRGEGDKRQIPGAEVAVVSNGTGQFAGCLLLTRDR